MPAGLLGDDFRMLRGLLPAVLIAALAIALLAASPAAAGKRKPDLVEPVVTAPATVVQGGSIGVGDTTKNAGKRKAKASVTRLSLSADQTSGAGDVKLADRDVPGLGKKKSSAATTQVVVPAATAPGKYFVLACADATRVVKEKKEKNNCRASGELTVTAKSVPQKSVAVNDPQTLQEDAPATPLNVRFNDTDADGPVENIASVTDPAHGTAAVISGGTKVSYRPDADYCNQPPGTATDNFTYRLAGGSTGTVAVTVTCVDDAPVANGDDVSGVLMDAGPLVINVLANDTDVDGGPKQIVSKTDPENGTVSITNGGQTITYTPDTNYCNDDGLVPEPDQFSYELNGGSSTIVSVTVACTRSHPTISQVSGEPNPMTCGIIANFNTPFSITGTGFDSGARVYMRFPDGTEYDAGGVTVSEDGTSITGTIAPDESRKTGKGVLRVKNGDGGYVDSAEIDYWPSGTICAEI